MKKSVVLFLALAALMWGCASDPLTASYKTSVGLDLAVKSSLAGWNTYIGIYHPGTNDELKVFNMFKTVKQAELTVVAAEQSVASNPTNTAPLTAALIALQASQTNFLATVASLTNSIHK